MLRPNYALGQPTGRSPSGTDDGYTRDEFEAWARRGPAGAGTGAGARVDRACAVQRDRKTYRMVVRQQPERARLCSFKEENETIDRRPVDPPPVIELQGYGGDAIDPVDCRSFFIRVTIVHQHPVVGLNGAELHAVVKTPTGAEATTGEVIQTPERLKLLDGRSCALCIFTKLSVRMPGLFRLKFTLYEVSEAGLTEFAHTASDPFEVFSPKLFKGMKESTPLTRHLAAQGLKVKLRTDTTVGRQASSRSRRRSSFASASLASTPSLPLVPRRDEIRHSSASAIQTHPARRAPTVVPSSSAPASASASTFTAAQPSPHRQLSPENRYTQSGETDVPYSRRWASSAAPPLTNGRLGPPAVDPRLTIVPSAAKLPGPSTGPAARQAAYASRRPSQLGFGDDGLPLARHPQWSPRIDWTLPHSDLSAFSLGALGGETSRKPETPSDQSAFYRSSSAGESSRRPRMPHPSSSRSSVALSLFERGTSSTQTSSQSDSPMTNPFPRTGPLFDISGDDGMPRLAFSGATPVLPTLSNLLSPDSPKGSGSAANPPSSYNPSGTAASPHETNPPDIVRDAPVSASATPSQHEGEQERRIRGSP